MIPIASRITLFAVVSSTVGAAAIACVARTEPTATTSGALTGGCVVQTGEMYQACFVDGTGLHQGDVHDGGMPVVDPMTKVIFAFEPDWAPRVEDLSATGIVTAYAGPENVDSFSDPVPEGDPSHAIAARIVETYDNGFEVAFDRPIEDGMQVDVVLAFGPLFRSRIGPPCDLPQPFWCQAGTDGINTRFYVGSVPPAADPTPSR
jgi:hypothetical protein